MRTINHRPFSKLRLSVPFVSLLGALIFSVTLLTLSFKSFNTMLHWCSSFLLFGWAQQPLILVVGAIAVAVILIGFVRAGFFIVRELTRSYRLQDLLKKMTAHDIDPFHSDVATNDSPRISIIHDDEPRALTVGLLFPRIMVSTGLLDRMTEEERNVIMLHELSHVERRDPLRRFLWEALRRFFYFVPTFADCVDSCIRNQEFLADYSIIVRDPRKKIVLRSCMQKMMLSAVSPIPSSSCAFDGNHKHLNWLFHDQKPEVIFSFSSSRIVYSLLLVLLLGIAHGATTYASPGNAGKTATDAFCATVQDSTNQSSEFSIVGDFIMINYSPVDTNQSLLK